MSRRICKLLLLAAAPVLLGAPTGVGEPAQDLAEDDCGLEVLRDPLAERPPIQLGRPGPLEVPRATFGIAFQDEVNPFGLMSTSLLPGETMTIEAVFTTDGARFEAEADGGTLTRLGPERWSYRASQAPGHECVRVTEVASGERICLNVFVLVPYAGEEVLNGFRIGRYEPEPLRGDPAYERPRGFVEVTEDNFDTWVSPHFRLGQFASKQPGGFPKYLVLSTRLLLKLETLLEEVEELAPGAATFHVMSGYRTPFYNASIGNTTKYSRHAYGDAADVFLDVDGDGVMDDLDGDGRSTAADARVLYDRIDAMVGEAWYMPFVGGLGLYGPNPSHGPFVHVDTRGARARW